jgi:threonine aldolase
VHGPIDLRSDTVSRPSPRMRQAMASAEVGDDWYGDDPTVNRLQDHAAELTGKEAAIYLPTGTMCTQVALHAFVRSGHLAACEASAHAGRTEASSAAVLSGIAFHYITAGSRGLLTAGQVEAALRPDPYDVSVIDLVTVENTHQVGGGTVMSVAELSEIAAVCSAGGVPLYLDGARIFNACVATGSPVRAYAESVSALMFCLSKGLGAPIGSVLAGDAEFVREARRLKILFGGAWRQAGIMAAAGLVALADGPGRLAEDHANARVLANGVADLLPGSVDPAVIETNIVFADVSGTGRSAPEWRDRLAAEGVLVTIIGDRIRMLTHVDISADDIDAAIAGWRRAAKD